MENSAIPKSLKSWFVLHFVVDMVFAIPLMLKPTWFLEALDWQTVDPITTRIVAAALFGIGIESYLGRNAGLESYKGMLNLKIIWSSGVIIGVGASLLQGAQEGPVLAWVLWTVFLAFNLLWVHWRLKLGKM
ncbi:MAG: hypothetical protein FVQ83_10750 [Chloroflexi bacterium]|nr:hypothetical protein [Chloroflexota bacterium]